MKKNILAIGIISLLIGIAILPICTASTNYTVQSTKENDSDEKPLPANNEFRFFRLKINGTVTGLQKKLFGYCGRSPMELTCHSLIRGDGNFTIPYNPNYKFTFRFVRWEKDYPYEDVMEPGKWHVNGTVILWHSYFDYS